MPPADAPLDILGKPYRAETLELPDDDEGPVVATLVHRAAAGGSRKAVLHLHGFCDYFFHTVLADFWVDRGYDFYALDLRKHGRSLLPHQTPNFAKDLADYWPELDRAEELIRERDGHDHLVFSGHSTGGLIGSLWLDNRSSAWAGVALNAPWLDFNGPFLMRAAASKAIEQVGARRPYQLIPRNVSGLYGRSIHTSHGGEWDFDTAWKPLDSWPVYAGWLRAIRRGHAAVHRGLDLRAPVLVQSSARSVHPRTWQPEVDNSDIVLDVDLMARWVHKLAAHVTLVRIDGALHDIVLSAAPIREHVFDELGRWLDAYVDRV